MKCSTGVLSICVVVGLLAALGVVLHHPIEPSIDQDGHRLLADSSTAGRTEGNIELSDAMLYPGTPLPPGHFEVLNPDSRWPNPGGPNPPLETEVTITYSYSGLDDLGIPCSEARAAVEEALGLWATYAPLKFVEVADSGVCPDSGDQYYGSGDSANLRFGTHSFDGGFGVLAHAYYPTSTIAGLSGDLHFDCAEQWVTSPTLGKIDFLEVCVHEIGHALGLAHEPTEQAIMNPYYAGHYSGLGSAFLFQDDIDGIQALYGAGTGSVTPINGGLCGECSTGCTASGDCLARSLVEEGLNVPGIPRIDELNPFGGSGESDDELKPIPDRRRERGMGLLNPLRHFRDQILARSDDGRDLIDAYYRHSPEATKLFGRRPDLAAEALSLIVLSQRSIKNAVQSQDGTIEVDRQVFDRGLALMAECRKDASSDFTRMLDHTRSFLTSRVRLATEDVVRLNLIETD